MSSWCENGNLWEGSEKNNWSRSSRYNHSLLLLEYTTGTYTFHYLHGRQCLEYWSCCTLEQRKWKTPRLSGCESQCHKKCLIQSYWETSWFGYLEFKCIPVAQEMLRILEFLVHFEVVGLTRASQFPGKNTRLQVYLNYIQTVQWDWSRCIIYPHWFQPSLFWCPSFDWKQIKVEILGEN